MNELIPHIDKSYRTIAGRKGRAIEGFSQGGRGTTRILFKHPQLWCSAAPGGSGYGPEKRIQENEGCENDKLRFLPLVTTHGTCRKTSEELDGQDAIDSSMGGYEGF